VLNKDKKDMISESGRQQEMVTFRNGVISFTILALNMWN